MYRLALVTALVLAAQARPAAANECNLYQSQQFGQIRVGCSITSYSLAPDVSPDLPNLYRNGQPIMPAVVHAEVQLQVLFSHYPTSSICDLVDSYENRTFDRNVISWDLVAREQITINDNPTLYTVPGPGD